MTLTEKQAHAERSESKMKTYYVTLPIAGHAFITVEAESEDAAIDAALNEVTIEHLESWEAIPHFNQGNVCYCPRPWDATAECDDDGEDSP
jgi:hypothetical protein